MSRTSECTPRCAGWSSSHQSSPCASAHSASWANSLPMKSSCLPGCAHMVARYLAQQRALAVHHLVVADRQYEVLAPGVHQRERHLVVVVLAVDRLVLHVLQRDVHPAHVPLQPEAEAAEVGR